MAARPPPPHVEVGSVIAGRYRVERVLGQGGMGIVVGAVHEGLAKRVAVKLLRPGAEAVPDAVARFVREARAAARLRTEHAVRVLDTGVHDGRPFMVMEQLEGRDLGALVDEGHRPTTSEAVGWLLQACEAVAEAHSLGIIHRDLKPSNLFLTSSATGEPLVKVLDFGISKLDDGDAANTRLTRTTDVMGSPSYMSPEQLKASRDVDARSDVWALGVILFELLTARVPFEGTTMTALVANVLTEPHPPLCSLRPDLPPELGAVVDRCLAKRADDRFATVVDLAAALEPFAARNTVDPVGRVRAAALGSGRSLPPTDSDPFLASGEGATVSASTGGSRPGSGHTRTAWGETLADPRVPSGEITSAAGVPRSAKPLLLGAAAVLVLGVGALTAAFAVAGRKEPTPMPLVATTTTTPEVVVPPPPASAAVQNVAVASATSSVAPPARVRNAPRPVRPSTLPNPGAAPSDLDVVDGRK